MADQRSFAAGKHRAKLESPWRRYRMADEVDAPVHRVERTVLPASADASSAHAGYMKLWER
ncbi:MAG TPA: hypothetical protein VLC49_13915 [Solirubrobacteraceae bacterium]|nr:hypothetical protein [Solirubrobacteraceae bacterium]